jgi:hypothetical protein
MSGGSTAFYLLPFVVTETRFSKSNTGMGFRLRGGPMEADGQDRRPKGAGIDVDTPVEIKYSWTGHKPSWGLLELAPILLGQIHF